MIGNECGLHEVKPAPSAVDSGCHEVSAHAGEQQCPNPIGGARGLQQATLQEAAAANLTVLFVMDPNFAK